MRQSIITEADRVCVRRIVYGTTTTDDMLESMAALIAEHRECAEVIAVAKERLRRIREMTTKEHE